MNIKSENTPPADEKLWQRYMPETTFGGVAQYYQFRFITETVQPRRGKELRLYVRTVQEGRWTLRGAVRLEPDVNMPGGESLIRQIYRGKSL